MKNIFFFSTLLCLFGALTVFSSCQKDDENIAPTPDGILRNLEPSNDTIMADNSKPEMAEHSDPELPTIEEFIENQIVPTWYDPGCHSLVILDSTDKVYASVYALAGHQYRMILSGTGGINPSVNYVGWARHPQGDMTIGDTTKNFPQWETGVQQLFIDDTLRAMTIYDLKENFETHLYQENRDGKMGFHFSASPNGEGPVETIRAETWHNGVYHSHVSGDLDCGSNWLSSPRFKPGDVIEVRIILTQNRVTSRWLTFV